MSAERSLFDSVLEFSDLVLHIERVMDAKSIDYKTSFGIFKNKAGVKTYSATLLIRPRGQKDRAQLIEGPTFRSLFDQTEEFLKTI
jgi:hypothetical protein